VLEGYIDEDLDYEDWLYSSFTWMGIADKCAMHEMYSLATDFYTLGISKDIDAFKKPNLWLRFAKSCYRCGRLDDANLAIKVISYKLTIEFCCLNLIITASTIQSALQFTNEKDSGEMV
jgi:hypothetical protein